MTSLNSTGVHPLDPETEAALEHSGHNALDRIKDDAGRAAGLIAMVQQLADGALDGHDSEAAMVAIQAVCGKAGFLVDRCVIALGGAPCRGSLEEWSDLEATA